MSAERSPATGRRYPLTQVCRVYRVPRSTGYDTAARTAWPVQENRVRFSSSVMPH